MLFCNNGSPVIRTWNNVRKELMHLGIGTENICQGLM